MQAIASKRQPIINNDAIMIAISFHVANGKLEHTEIAMTRNKHGTK
jgi:hypothetical protein